MPLIHRLLNIFMTSTCPVPSTFLIDRRSAIPMVLAHPAHDMPLIHRLLNVFVMSTCLVLPSPKYFRHQLVIYHPSGASSPSERNATHTPAVKHLRDINLLDPKYFPHQPVVSNPRGAGSPSARHATHTSAVEHL
ncbi:hypothetical protein AMTR_s00073p00098590 [Amborella trichopoda]|uniref:Uncharacterized protein n=1 Tax=Amborella trichopoda TaxID=13333 RepID=W1NNH6_AMBTC|nr:hypothetical protein AMTR_s00073p00098590 [Amborella trichopoda]